MLKTQSLWRTSSHTLALRSSDRGTIRETQAVTPVKIGLIVETQTSNDGSRSSPHPTISVTPLTTDHIPILMKTICWFSGAPENLKSTFINIQRAISGLIPQRKRGWDLHGEPYKMLLYWEEATPSNHPDCNKEHYVPAGYVRDYLENRPDEAR